MLVGDPNVFVKAVDVKPGSVIAETLEGVHCLAVTVLIELFTVRIACCDLVNGILPGPTYIRIYGHNTMLLKLA